MVELLLAVRVLLLGAEEPAISDRFVETLQIQLAGIALVDPGRSVRGATLSEQVGDAVALVKAENAALAVWLDRERGDRSVTYVLHVVGQRQGRVLVQVFEMSGSDGAALDRAVALKVGEMLDAVLAPPAGEPSPVAWVGASAAGSTRAARPALLLDLGARGFAGLDAPAAQPTVGVGIGFRHSLAPVQLEALAAVQMAAGFAESANEGRVSVSDQSLAASARCLMPVGPVELGPAVSIRARRISAEGTTSQGARGETALWLASFDAAAEARRALRPGWALRAALGLEVAATRHRLSVNDLAVVDLGRVRPFAEISLVITPN